MALGDPSTKRNALVRFLLLLAILILSILILPFAFTNVVAISSNFTTIRPILMLYDLLFPFDFILYILV
jgi:hypothetical protein